MRKAAAAYDPPTLRVVGSISELTEWHRPPNRRPFCFWRKTIGPPDYFAWIPVTNCSP